MVAKKSAGKRKRRQDTESISGAEELAGSPPKKVKEEVKEKAKADAKVKETEKNDGGLADLKKMLAPAAAVEGAAANPGRRQPRPPTQAAAQQKSDADEDEESSTEPSPSSSSGSSSGSSFVPSSSEMTSDSDSDTTHESSEAPKKAKKPARKAAGKKAKAAPKKAKGKSARRRGAKSADSDSDDSLSTVDEEDAEMAAKVRKLATTALRGGTAPAAGSAAADFDVPEVVRARCRDAVLTDGRVAELKRLYGTADDREKRALVVMYPQYKHELTGVTGSLDETAPAMAVFNNTYLLMRHGQSKANVAGKIVSAPEVGCTEYGLTEVGQGQARAAAARLLGEGGERVGRVVTSDFTRARETALIAAEVLGAPAPAEDVRLRERYFGDLDLGAHDQYAKVWERDAASCTHTEFNVESTASVRRRALGLIADLEGSCTGTVIILVAHGDTLQILSTAFHGLRPGRHRELPHHETGDIKLLVQQGAPVPEEVRQG